MHKTRLNDPVHVVHGDERSARRLPPVGLRGLPRRLRQRPRSEALRAVRASRQHGQSADRRSRRSPRHESGHPLAHRFTRSIPTSQCMVCHMHQPNMFMNSSWATPCGTTSRTRRHVAGEAEVSDDRRRSARSSSAIPRARRRAANGRISTSCNSVSELNPTLHDTQFADYHGHGWNFRAVFKRDRHGNLLDAEGAAVERRRSAEIPEGRPHGLDPHGQGHALRRLPLLAGQPWQRLYLRRGRRRRSRSPALTAMARRSSYPTLRTSGPAARPRART